MTLKEAEGSVRIDLPREQVWDQLCDLSLAHNYVPGVAATRIDTQQREGVGASRTVIMNNGSEMQETVEEWDEGRSFLLRLHRGDKPAMPIFKRFYFRYAIEDDGHGTLSRPALLYETRFGLLGWMLGKLAHRQMQKSAQDVGIAMKDFYETGNRVTPERLKELKNAKK